MIGVGLVLGSLAGLELSVREHFAGYRSHTLLLTVAAGVGTLALLLVIGLTPIAGLAIGLAVAGFTALLLVRAFRRRSGGAAFKLR